MVTLGPIQQRASAITRYVMSAITLPFSKIQILSEELASFLVKEWKIS